MQNLTIEVQKSKSDLITSTTDKMRLQAFIDSLPEGAKVECFYSFVIDPSEKSLGQLAKVHVLIKQLATDTGHSNDEIKTFVKQKCSLMDLETGQPKSFKDCSKSELSNAIQACIEIGNEIGSHLH